MRLRMWGLGVLACALPMMCVPAAMAAGPSVRARAAIILDAETGEVLWSKQADVALPPASTTKVMTALLAVESGRFDESFRVSPYAQSTQPSRIGLRSGQRMKVDDLVHAVLMKSANDASVVVAEGLGGSVAGFGRQMTARARELGATRTTFRNPHGLTQKGHVASARDLAIIFRHATRNPKVRSALETRAVQVAVQGPGARRVSLASHNRLLSGWKHQVIGKTGWTRAAGKCFVGSTRHDGREIVIALLGSTDLWGDARTMFSWALDGKPRLPERQLARRDSPPAAAPEPRVVATALVVPTPAPPAAEPLPSWVTASCVEGSPAPDASRFTVRFGPFDDEPTFEHAKTQLAGRGYTPLSAGRALRLGEFASADRALHLARRMRHSGWDADVVALY